MQGRSAAEKCGSETVAKYDRQGKIYRAYISRGIYPAAEKKKRSRRYPVHLAETLQHRPDTGIRIFCVQILVWHENRGDQCIQDDKGSADKSFIPKKICVSDKKIYSNVSKRELVIKFCF